MDMRGLFRFLEGEKTLRRKRVARNRKSLGGRRWMEGGGMRVWRDVQRVCDRHCSTPSPSSHVLPCPPTVFRFLATPFLLRVFSPSRNRKSPCMSICISLQYYCHPWTHNIILFSHPLVVLDNATRGMPRCARCATRCETGPMPAPVHCTSAARTIRAASTAMRALCAHAHARARACPATKSFPTPQRSCPTERS